jgi:hypothetical protein
MKNGGWLDNYGKADNANDSDVSLPEGFVGMGNDTTGRNNSPAWGGQFQTGGSIPGSVGFTYARTGDIPSNGKYAKKTMASAQNGGNWLNKIVAENVYPYGGLFNRESDYKIDNKTQYELSNKFHKKDIDFKTYKKLLYDNSYNDKGMSISESYKNNKGSKPIPDPKDLNASYDALYLHQDLPQKYNSFVESLYLPTVTTDKSRKTYSLNTNYESELIKDLFEGRNKDFLDSDDKIRKIKNSNLAGAALKNFKYSKGNDDKGAYISYYDLNDYGNLLDFIGEPFDIYGRFYYDEKTKKPIQIPKKQNGGEMKFYQEGLDWKPRSMQDGGEADSFLGKTKKFIAKEISDPSTIKALSVLDYLKPLNNKEVYNTVRPTDYPNAFKLPMLAYNYLMGNKTEPLKTRDGKPHISEEFWANALNIPGERQYLKESEYKPSKSKNPNAKYYTIRDIIDEDDLLNLTKDLEAGKKMEINGLSSILDTKWYSKNANTENGISFEDLDPLQRFTLEKSDDGSYVSMYDKYDFDNPALNRMLNTFEIYDRFYLPKKRDGGVIKDNRGQWDHPGEITEIDSNEITMQGVPYNVLGVSNTGDTKLMQPGNDYKFKGSKVTEFPVAKNGGWLDSYQYGGSVGINQLDAQPKKKLNQLTNFTNNPDKTNWLDKYN